jgi:2,3-dihydroxybenzoate decarboxylase
MILYHLYLNVCCPDTPYENVKEGQDWWKSVVLPGGQKEAVARRNAIRLFKLPLNE